MWLVGCIAPLPKRGSVNTTDQHKNITVANHGGSQIPSHIGGLVSKPESAPVPSVGCFTPGWLVVFNAPSLKEGAIQPTNRTNQPTDPTPIPALQNWYSTATRSLSFEIWRLSSFKTTVRSIGTQTAPKAICWLYMNRHTTVLN